MKKTVAIFPMSLVFFCLFLLSFSACEQINHYKDKALSLVGFTKEEPTKKTTPTDKDLKDKDTPLKKNKTGNNDDIIVTRVKADTQAIKKTDLKAAIAPPFTVEAPVDIKRRVGGSARFITADDKFTYLDFPQHFAVYDTNLSLVARHPISYPLLHIKRHDIGDKTYFYLTEEKNVLEIYELQTVTEENTSYYALKEVASYDAGATFTWVNAKLLVILYKDKIQFNDFSNFDEPKTVAEMPIGNVTATFPIGKYLFLARQDFLDIVDTESYTLVSTVRVGSLYGFLGETRCKNKTCLVLSQLTPEGHLKGLQYLQITEDGSAVIDLGDNIPLGKTLSSYTFDLNRGLIIGKEVSEKNQETPVHLFSVNERRVLRGPLSQEANLLTWSLAQNHLYLVTHLDITINQITLNNDVISQSLSLKTTPHTSSVTPLAQIGATKLIKDEYALVNQTRVEFMAEAKKVFLLDRDHFVIFESSQDQKHHRIYASSNFSQDSFTLVEPAADDISHYAKVLPSSLGLFLYADNTKKLSLLDPGFEAVKTLPVKIDTLGSLAQFSSGDQEILALTATAETKNKITVAFNLDFYALKSLQDIELKCRATFDELPHLVFIPSDQVVAIIKNKMFLYSWNGILHPESETKIETDPTATKPVIKKTPAGQIPVPTAQETINYDLGGLDYTLVSAKVAPSYDMIYLLIETKKRLKIAVMDLFDVTNFAILEDFEITPEEFDGSTFAKDGRLFILPSSEGTLFYDMTHLENIKEVAHWPLESEHVDVVDNGRFICVALEHLGVYCGDLLF